MKEFFKNKKVLIGIASVLILAIVITGSILLFKDNKEDTKENKILKEQTYTMYVKINPLVKLTFKETYYECSYTNDNGEEEKTICSDEEDSIIDYTLINDDAKDIYNSIDFKGKTVLDALLVLCDVARDNKVAFDSLEIVSDYSFDEEELIKKIASGSTYEREINVYVDFKERINEDEIIKDLEKEDSIKTYIVSFDSNGGSKIDKQEIKENEKANIPTTPTKAGYDFVEWQLNGKKYNFDTNITSNITLTATWKKKSNQSTNNANTNNNQNNNSSNTNNNNSNNSNNNQSNSNNDNSNTNKVPSQENNNTDNKPNNNKNIINLNDNVLYGYYEDVYQCDKCITSSILNSVKSSKGYYHKSAGSDDDTSWIRYQKISSLSGIYNNSTYFGTELNIGNKIEQNGGIYVGGQGESSLLLTEEICKKYNLLCDRW